MASFYNSSEILSGLHSFVSEVCSIPSERVDSPIISNALGHSAICNGVTLTVLDTSADARIVSEVDFESELISVSWDAGGECVVVGDSGGTLHLVLSDGSLLFSKKLPIGGTN